MKLSEYAAVKTYKTLVEAMYCDVPVPRAALIATRYLKAAIAGG